MAKAKKAVKQTATPTATSGTKATKRAAKPSSSSAPKKAGKKVTSKPKLETKQVCFIDQKTGKKFCGEMTEVPEKKGAAKVGAVAPRRRGRR